VKLLCITLHHPPRAEVLLVLLLLGLLLLLALRFCSTAWQFFVCSCAAAIYHACDWQAPTAAKAALLQQLMLLDDDLSNQQAQQQHKLHTVQDNPAKAQRIAMYCWKLSCDRPHSRATWCVCFKHTAAELALF